MNRYHMYLYMYADAVSCIVQMMGHVKTVAIFAISWIVLQENFSSVKWLGCCLTISGLYLFNKQPKHLALQQAAKLDTHVSVDEELKKPLK